MNDNPYDYFNEPSIPYESRGNAVLDKSFAFALGVIEFCNRLDEGSKFSMSNQLFRSGTGIGANCREAQSAESRADFIHKIKIADKEARETEFWLELSKESKSYPNPGNLVKDIKEIILILSKIIITARKNQNK